MEKRYYSEYSQCLDRNMDFIVYGHSGVPLLVFPAQDGHPQDYENFGMVDVIKDKIENGYVQLFCVGSIDEESYSDEMGDKARRSYLLEPKDDVKNIDLSKILNNPFTSSKHSHHEKNNEYDFKLNEVKDTTVLYKQFKEALDKHQGKEIDVHVTNIDRSFGTLFGSKLTAMEQVVNHLVLSFLKV